VMPWLFFAWGSFGILQQWVYSRGLLHEAKGKQYKKPPPKGRGIRLFLHSPEEEYGKLCAVDKFFRSKRAVLFARGNP
jgi:hypothetical protein